MIPQLLEHLDKLRAALDAIDPAQDIAAADKVADIAAALRRLTAVAQEAASGADHVGQAA